MGRGGAWLLVLVLAVLACGHADRSMKVHHVVEHDERVPGKQIGQSPWLGGLPLLRSLPDDTLRIPERTRVRVTSLAHAAEIVVEQDVRVPEDAEGLVVLWPRPPGATLRDVVVERGGQTITLSWWGPEELTAVSRYVRETEAVRLHRAIPELQTWGIVELPRGEQVTMRLRYQQDHEAHDEHHLLTVPLRLGPTFQEKPLYEAATATPVELTLELDAAAPIAAYRVSDFGAHVQVDGNRLSLHASTTGDGEAAAVVEHWITTDQARATMSVDPVDGSFALVVTGPRDVAPRPPEDVMIVDHDFHSRASDGLAKELTREIVSRLRSTDRFDFVSLSSFGGAGFASFGEPLRADPELRKTYNRFLELYGHDLEQHALIVALAEKRPRRLVILTENGREHDPRTIARRRAQLRDRGIELRVDVIAVGSEPISPRLRRLAAAGGGLVVRARDFLGTRGVVDAISPEAGGLRELRVQWGVPVRTAVPDEPLRVDAGRQVIVYGQLEGPPPEHVELHGRLGDEEVHLVAPVRTWPDTPMLRERHALARIDAMRRADIEQLGSRSSSQRVALAEAHALEIEGARLAVSGAKAAELIEPIPKRQRNWREVPLGEGVIGCRGGYRVFYEYLPDLETSLLDPVRDEGIPPQVYIDVGSVRATSSSVASERVVRAGARELRACLDRTLDSGELKVLPLGVRLHVSEDGTVSAMERISGQRPMITTEDCMAEVMETWTFPARGTPTTVEIDLTLWFDRMTTDRVGRVPG